jgi:hypothetical protein
MHVQDLKRWHWVLISLVVGLLLSFAWSQMEDETLPSISQHDFETGLGYRPDAQGRYTAGAFIRARVLPAKDGKNMVMGLQVRPTAVAGKGDARPVVYVADIPYKAGLWRGQMDEEYPNVRAYLEKTKKDNPDLGWHYAWWREKWAVYVLWTSASLLLIGGVWPSVVSLMVGAGLGFQSEDAGPEYDLSRFKSEAEKQAGAKGPTAADLQHLHDLEDELEKKLAAERAGMPMPDTQPGQQPAAAKKLDGGPLEAASTGKPAEEHEYTGEFYPVDHGAKKKS